MKILGFWTMYILSLKLAFLTQLIVKTEKDVLSVLLFLTSLLLQPFMHYIKSVHFNYVVWVYWTIMGFFSNVLVGGA